ncbi:MAG: hypothetical protein KatS3mg076_2910 [Candidatus Binatia bacterium]|nr:MAG: hypothetical protein KatS3mg076_2910 [Candidatus Binatia bacterium]
MVRTTKDAILEAFERLYAKAAHKLGVRYTEKDVSEARENFARRFAAGLEALDALRIEKIPDEVIEEMEKAIDELSPSEVVAYLASIPLVHKGQELLRTLAYQQAERRLLEYALQQADDTYGGN